MNDKNKYNHYIVTMTISLAEFIKARDASGPRYRAIAEAIADAIAAGELTPGEKLPPMRELAWQLGVTTGTVARAYALGVTRQYLASEVGRGTFVHMTTPPTTAPALALPTPANETRDATIAMKANLPADVGQEQMLAAETMAMLQKGNARHFDYLPAGGATAHREAGAKWLATGAFTPSPADIILTSGAQQAILAAILATTEPGDTILTEALSYHAITAQALMLDRRVAPVEIDEEGLIPDALARACRSLRASVLFTVPTLHNPTTATMSAKRRADIAEVAMTHRLDIIEDDIYANLMEPRPLPLAHWLANRSWYINSLSKAVAPGLRTAYLVPPREHHERCRAIVHGLGQTLPPLVANLSTRLIENGSAAALVARQRTEIAARNEIASQILGDARRRQNAAAMHLWLELPEHWRASAFTDAARHRGVTIATGEEFMVGRPDKAARHVRLCLGAPHNRAELEQGLQIVSKLTSESPIETQSLA
ncbi:MAG: PLP-dependent aminotransferase family protein [Parvibaculum sp.]